MNVKPIKTAIVGCGMISKSYLDTITKHFQIIEVYGCCDMFKEKAEEMAAKYEIKALTMEELLNDASIELVINLTIPAAHYEVTKQLLEAGKHVYTEKVLATSVAEAKELVRIADEKKLYLGVAPDTFLGSAIQTARRVVDSGMIGEVSSCYCALNRELALGAERSTLGIKKGGGIGFDVGIYYITALLSILGPVTEVCGMVRTINPERKHFSIERLGEAYELECENIMAGTLQFKSGAVGNVLFDSNTIFTIPEKPAFAIFGSMGILFMADPNMFGGEVKVLLKGSTEPILIPSVHGFRSEFRGLGAAEMAWSIRENRKNRASKEMGLHAVEILHGIVSSCENRTFSRMSTTFEMTEPLPAGYLDLPIFGNFEESALTI